MSSFVSSVTDYVKDQAGNTNMSAIYSDCCDSDNIDIEVIELAQYSDNVLRNITLWKLTTVKPDWKVMCQLSVIHNHYGNR